MPTIHAVGGPAKACATTRVRCSGSVHAAIAAMPAARIIEIPIHIGICASASSVNDGAAALASEPTARSTLATPSSARGEYRVSSRPATSAATTASGAARIRSCPAAAIETPKSSATSLRIGERTSTPAWLATNARKSTSEGDATAPPSRPEVGPEKARAGPPQPCHKDLLRAGATGLRAAGVSGAANRTHAHTVSRGLERGQSNRGLRASVRDTGQVRRGLRPSRS